jgi:hypothetical protein
MVIGMFNVVFGQSMVLHKSQLASSSVRFGKHSEGTAD